MASAQEVGKLIVRLIGDTKQFEAAMKKAGKTAQNVGKKLSLYLTVPLAGVGAVATREFARFDQAMTESTSIMKVTAKQTQRMREQAKLLATEGPQGPEELARSYFFLASAGLDAEKAMKALPTVQKFATAGAFDMALATDLLTDAQSALGMVMQDANANMKEMTRLADVLVKANTLANASVQQFSESLTNDAGAALRQVNKEVEEGVAILAVYADQGIKGQVAGSMLGRALNLLKSRALENAKQFEQFGINVFDSNGEMRNMADIIADMERAFAGLSTEQKTAALEQLGFTALVQKAILPLIGNSEKMRQYEEALRSAGGTTADVAGKQMQSFSNQLATTKNLLKTVAIDIGETLAPWLLKLNNYIKGLIKRWQALSPTTKRWIVLIGSLTAALGPLVVALGILVSSIGTVVGVLGSIVNPVTAVIAAVGAAAAAVLKFAGVWDTAIEGARSFFSRVVGFFANFSDNMIILWDWLKKNWKIILLDFLPNLFITFVKNSASNILVLIRIHMRLFSAWSGWLVGLFKKVFTVDFLKWVWEGVKKVAKVFIDFAKKAWEALKSIFTGKKVTMADFSAQLQKDFEKGMKKGNILDVTKDILAEETKKLKSPFEGLETKLLPPKLKTDFGKQVKKTFDLSGSLRSAFDSAKDTLSSWWKSAKDWFTKLGDHAKAQSDKVKQAIDRINSAVTFGSDEFFSLLSKVGQFKPSTKQPAPKPTPLLAATPLNAVGTKAGKTAISILDKIHSGIKRLGDAMEEANENKGDVELSGAGL